MLMIHFSYVAADNQFQIFENGYIQNDVEIPMIQSTANESKTFKTALFVQLIFF